MSDDSLSLFPGGSPVDAGGRSDGTTPPVAARPHPDTPLAERMRPRSLDEIVGQAELVGPSGFLRRLQEGGHFPSLILHGPPGSGKTTLGRLLATTTGAEFVPFNSVSEGVPRLREVVKTAREWRKAGRRTLLFVDEIHRLNKGQQDFLLPFVESGLVTLVGATTEHPAFEVNPALLSRTRVLLLRPMKEDELRLVVNRAMTDSERGLGHLELELTPEAEELIVEASAGDARKALNAIEVGSELVGRGGTIDLETARQALQRRISQYDASTAFQMLSAFHKSLRASQGDAALYWAMRMIHGGEDPLVLFRRLIAAAYEDVGLADPHAGVVATQAMQAFERLGPPEGFLPLANAVLYVAHAPKSNRAYLALSAARDAAERTADAAVPLRLRNPSTGLMREWGFGEGYEYAHNHENAYVELECLPDEVVGSRFYDPAERGHEARIRALMRERGQLE